MNISAASVRSALLLSTTLAGSIIMAKVAVAQTLPTGASTPQGPAPTYNNVPSPAGGTQVNVALNQARTVINWNTFNVGETDAVNFTNGVPAAEAVLNRVSSTGGFSSIYGTIKSEPDLQVFLINPSGIIFRSSSVVNVGSLVASTLDVADADFLDGGTIRFSSASPSINAVRVQNFGEGSSEAADITAQNGVLFVGGAIDVSPQTNIRALNGRVALVGSNDVTVDMSTGSPLSIRISGPTPVANAINIEGQVSGDTVHAFMETPANVSALLSVNGTITATNASGVGGDINLTLSSRDNTNAIVNSPGTIRNTGALNAEGNITIWGGRSINTGAQFNPRFVENSGTISAVGDVNINAGEAITLNGTTEGRDLALNAGLSVIANVLRARDDIAIRVDDAEGSVDARDLTSGTTVRSIGPQDAIGAADGLVGGSIDLTGHDIDINGSVMTANLMAAFGTSSDIRIRTSVSAPVDVYDPPTPSVAGDLTFRADGSITIEGSAQARDVAMDAGGSLTVQNVSASDDIWLKAGGSLTPGILQSGMAVLGTPVVDVVGSADALHGATLLGHDITAQASTIILDGLAASQQPYTSSALAVGGGSDIHFIGAVSVKGILAETAETENDLDLIAGGDIVITGSAQARDIALKAGGFIDVGTLAARDDIAIRATGTVATGTLTSGTTIAPPTNAPAQTAPIDTYGAADYLLAGEPQLFEAGTNTPGHDIDITGTSIFANENTALGVASDIRLQAPVTAAILDLSFAAGGDITILGSASGRDVAMDAVGNITVADITARDDIVLRGGGTIDPGVLDSGSPVSGAVDQVGSADALLGALPGNDIEVRAPTIRVSEAFAGISASSDVRLLGAIPSGLADDVYYYAGGDVTVQSALGATDVVIEAGGAISVGDIAARDDIVLSAGGTIAAGSLTSGATVAGLAPIDAILTADSIGADIRFGLANPTPPSGLIAIPLLDDGRHIVLSSPNMVLSNVTANGTFSDIVMSGGVTAASNTTLHLIAGRTIDNYAPINTGGVVLFNAGQDIINRGAINAGFGLTPSNRYDIYFTADHDILNSGTLSTLQSVGFFAQNDIINSGAIQSSLTVSRSGDEDVEFQAGRNIVNSGAITVGEATSLRANNDITNSAPINAGSMPVQNAGVNIFFDAAHDINNSGSLAGGEAVWLQAGHDLANSARIEAGLSFAPNLSVDIDLDAGNEIRQSGQLIAGETIRLNASGNVDHSGLMNAAGDVSLTAGGDILDSSGTLAGVVQGRDIVLSSGGSLTVGTISARDDIAIHATGPVTVETLTAGATIGASGPFDVVGVADTLLTGTSLAGHDIGIGGSSITVSRISALGSDSDIRLQATVTALRGDLDFAAGGDISITNPISARDIALNAGGAITAANISALDDIAMRAGGAVDAGVLTSGATVNGVGPVDAPGSADALLGIAMVGNDLSVDGSALALSKTNALGLGDLSLHSVSGALMLTSGSAGGSVSLVKEGAVGALAVGTLVAGTGATLVSSTGMSADRIESANGGIRVDAGQKAFLGTVLAGASAINVLADDLDIFGGLSGDEVTLTNRIGGNMLTVLGDATASTGSFTLTEAELNRIAAPITTVQSLDQSVLIGNLALGGGVGSTRLNLLMTGRIDLIGQLTAAGTGRSVQIGGTTVAADPRSPATLASIIRIAATSTGGGRILLDGAALDLRGAKIGVGLDDGFLSDLGLTPGGSPLATATVVRDWVRNPSSTLYGIPGGYANPVVLRASSINVSYTDYALFQNTAARNARVPTGVDVGSLLINSSGTGADNGFSLFGSVGNVTGGGAALLVQSQEVAFTDTRINGCIAQAGCQDTTVLPIPFFVLDVADAATTQAGAEAAGQGGANSMFVTRDIVSTDEERRFSFESLVGTNNEGLLGGLGVDDTTVSTKDCADGREGEVCKAEERVNEQ